MGLFYSAEVGKGSDRPDIYTHQQLRQQAASFGTARTQVRFFWQADANGRLQPQGVHISKSHPRSSVRVRSMAWNASAQQYEMVGIDESEPTIVWTPANPAGSELSSSIGYPLPDEGAIQSPILVNPIPWFDKDAQILPLPAQDESNFNDFILVFPADSGVPPIYAYFNSHHKYHVAPRGYTPLPGFPNAKLAKRKTSIQGGGGLRPRWKDLNGNVYEWDYQHGTVEIYNKRGHHLGEFNHETGEQIKPADIGRKIEP